MWNVIEVIATISLITFGVGLIIFLLSIALDVSFNVDIEWMGKAGLGTTLFGLVFLISFWIPLAVHQEGINKDACLAAGGTYKVVDSSTQYVMSSNVVMPVTSDIYGCVK